MVNTLVNESGGGEKSQVTIKEMNEVLSKLVQDTGRNSKMFEEIHHICAPIKNREVR